MAEAIKTKIGFVSGGASTMPHYSSFLPMIPAVIQFDFQGLELYGDSLYEIAGKKEFIVRRVAAFVDERQWNGVIITAAPTEVLNPGLFDGLKARLAVPFTTALHACVAALKVYSAQRVLLLTPFDERLNTLICRHLAGVGVSAVAPHPFDKLDVPKRMNPAEVFQLAEKSLKSAGDIDAVYFQGAVLDLIRVLEKMETELGVTTIASNPAMFWYLLSRLQLSCPMQGYGRLLREWPKLDS